MRSDSAQVAGHGGAAERPIVRRILDPAFGLFVWAAHLVVIYVAQSVSCVLGIPSRSARAETGVLIALTAVTLAAALVVGAHGLRRYRQRGETDSQQFLFDIAVGQDAIAAVAILWQLIPIFMVPLCH